jgi:hypothetical protein
MDRNALPLVIKLQQGGFSLHPGGAKRASPLGYQYYELFGDVNPTDETILSMYVTVDIVSRNILTIRSLNGPNFQALFGYSGWNGSISTPGVLPLSSMIMISAEKQFLVGPQPGGVDYSTTVTSLRCAGSSA